MATTTSSLQRRSGVYVLELKDPGYFYVGSSADLDARVEQHHMVGGTRSVKFVTDHGGVANVIPPLTPPEASLVSWEMKETIARMIRHGFNHVRGWEYAFPNALKERTSRGFGSSSWYLWSIVSQLWPSWTLCGGVCYGAKGSVACQS